MTQKDYDRPVLLETDDGEFETTLGEINDALNQAGFAVVKLVNVEQAN